MTPQPANLAASIHQRLLNHAKTQEVDFNLLLARFAITARDETDMNALTAELAQTVQETLEPAAVKVWLKGTRRW